MLFWVLFRKLEGQFQSGLATRDAFEAVQDIDWFMVLYIADNIRHGLST